jgi:hypothetical protein
MTAFLKEAQVPNVPIEQLFKRVRLEVDNTTDGKQTPWESSSLTSDFTFFGDTAVAAMRPPVKAPVVQMASNLPNRSVRQAYDYVLSENSPQYYQEFVTLYPHDPLCDRIRWLLREMLMAQAWHKAVLANSPFAYKTFADNFANSPYAEVASKLQAQPKIVPLMQATHLIVPPQLAPSLKPGNFGLPKEGTIKLGDTVAPVQGGKLGIALGDKPKGDITVGNSGINGGKLDTVGKVVTLPSGISPKTDTPASDPKKIVTLPAPVTTGTATTGGGKIVTLPATTGGNGSKPDATKTTGPVKRIDLPVKPQFQVQERRETVTPKLNVNPQQVGRPQGKILPAKVTSMGGNNGPHFAQSNNQGQARRGFMR